MPNRRRFLCQMCSATALAVLTPRLVAAAAMRSRVIPGSGELLPILGLGSASGFDVAANDPRERQLRAVLDLFFASGATLLDTSPTYGRTEAALGRLLGTLTQPAHPFLALKMVAEDRATAEAQLERSLRALRVDRVDLLQVHTLRNWRAQLRLARAWKAEGRTRYIGISHFHSAAHPLLYEAIREMRPDFVQVNYSVADWRAENKVLPAARDAGVAVIVNRCFEDGSLFMRTRGMPLPPWAGEFAIGSWAQLFLKFSLSHPAVTVAAVTTSNPRHLQDNLGAVFGPDLDEKQRAAIKQLAL